MFSPNSSKHIVIRRFALASISKSKINVVQFSINPKGLISVYNRQHDILNVPLLNQLTHGHRCIKCAITILGKLLMTLLKVYLAIEF